MSFKLLLAASLFGALSLALAIGCSDDHSHDDGDGHSHGTSSGGEHTSKFPSCQAILTACHPLDKAEGPIHDCHEVAHAPGASEEGCAAEKDRCVTTVCVAPADAGTDDASASDAGSASDADAGS